MAVSQAMRRLLRIRDIQEEQSRLTLESAMGELRRLEAAMVATTSMDRHGRRLVETSAHTGELEDRLSGIEEARTASRHATMLVPRIEAAETGVNLLRREFLQKRVARRQAETLIQETAAVDAVDAGRHNQQALDDWYRFRLHSAKNEDGAEKVGPTAEKPEGSDPTS
jgi:hypothetical protein